MVKPMPSLNPETFNPAQLYEGISYADWGFDEETTEQTERLLSRSYVANIDYDSFHEDLVYPS